MLEILLQAGIPTIENLGNMTPEELEAIPGIGPTMVEKIQDAVVSYYGQYENVEETSQSEESAEQHPSLEMGENEEGAEPGLGAEASEADQPVSPPSEDEQDNPPTMGDEGGAGDDSTHQRTPEAPEESDNDESARIK
jgi:N utilization substance protein A